MRVPWPLILLGAVVLVSGCATTTRASYEKPGVSDAERKRDENECLRSALDHTYRAHILIPIAIDREVFRSCLEARGYKSTRE